MLKAIKRLFKDESGQGLVEYALIIGVVVIAIIVAFNVSGIKTQITNIFNRLTGHLTIS